MDLFPAIIFMIVLLLGNLSVSLYRKTKATPDYFFYNILWTFVWFVLYVAIIEAMTKSYVFLIPYTVLAIFAYFYWQDKARLINGFLFNTFILTFGGYLLYNIFRTQNMIVGGILALALFCVVLILIFGFIGSVIFLYWNSLVVLRKESRSLANMLTLLLAIGLTLLFIYNTFIEQFLPLWIVSLSSIIPLTITYFLVVFCNFLTISIIYQFNRPRYNQDYIIVLGAGLIDGERVTPLLAKRIDKAIAFYHQQIAQTGKVPHILMSGGQGPDEKVPESYAMKAYACEQGIPEADVLEENESTTTLENMRFSKNVMDERQPKDYRVIFTSNNYHIFRAGIFASQANLKTEGLGAKTAFYYLPNAFLREFIAIVMMRKRRHAFILGSLFFMICALTILTSIIN